MEYQWDTWLPFGKLVANQNGRELQEGQDSLEVSHSQASTLPRNWLGGLTLKTCSVEHDTMGVKVLGKAVTFEMRQS